MTCASDTSPQHFIPGRIALIRGHGKGPLPHLAVHLGHEESQEKSGVSGASLTPPPGIQRGLAGVNIQPFSPLECTVDPLAVRHSASEELRNEKREEEAAEQGAPRLKGGRL
ncbi:hypothetical protein DPEC_G00125280 [Dallia pectoralis]|uniref:Uncharacterized protein n=1 Tax=Dallia pectoralis TaxID=75939 RepID=A0ACC2GR89_DALPE|nr:hypothetical protein DPEC_G00125280 [Dallia pectoralis]